MKTKALGNQKGQSPAVKLGQARRVESVIPPPEHEEAIDSFFDDGGDEAEESVAAEKGRVAAFNREPAWHGARLYPFGSGREGLWLELRTAMGSPALRRVLGSEDGAQPFLADALRIVWLCLQPAEARDARPGDPDRECLADLREDLRGVQARIDRWADAEVARDEQPEITALGLLIYNDALVNQAQPMPSGKPEVGGEGDSGESPAR